MDRPKEGFSKIERQHAEQACRQMIASNEGQGGGSYFVSFNGHLLPAKSVLRAAYKLATGSEISSKAFSGGVYTQRILEHLGLTVQVRRTSTHDAGTNAVAPLRPTDS